MKEIIKELGLKWIKKLKKSSHCTINEIFLDLDGVRMVQRESLSLKLV